MISITLPSLYPEILVTCLENLDASTAGPFEVVVVGPEKPRVGLKRGTLVWIEEHEQRGIAAAHEQAFRASEGSFVLAWADDHLMEGGWDNAALSEFGARERTGKIFSLGLRHTPPHDHVQTIFGRFYPCFPLMRRADVLSVGGWLSGAFRHGFSDSDLALRVWESGGRCEWSNVRPVRVTQGSARGPKPVGYEEALNADRDLLVRGWRHIVETEGWDCSDASRFNTWISPAMPLFDTEERTVFHPFPAEFWAQREARKALHAITV
jgi:GT2 family glycosyltransferase